MTWKMTTASEKQEIPAIEVQLTAGLEEALGNDAGKIANLKERIVAEVKSEILGPQKKSAKLNPRRIIAIGSIAALAGIFCFGTTLFASSAALSLALGAVAALLCLVLLVDVIAKINERTTELISIGLGAFGLASAISAIAVAFNPPL